MSTTTIFYFVDGAGAVLRTVRKSGRSPTAQERIRTALNAEAGPGVTVHIGWGEVKRAHRGCALPIAARRCDAPATSFAQATERAERSLMAAMAAPEGGS